MSLLAPVSVGEFLDKLTILEIKSDRIKDSQKLDNIAHELLQLQSSWQCSDYAEAKLEPEYSELKAVNERLWVIEDDIRELERTRRFDTDFIAPARAVYINNDERATLKKALNLKLGSDLVEEKSYADY